jgi:hypothetical protein
VVVGAGVGADADAGEDAADGVSSSTTIGGGEGAVDDFLVQVAAPHVHLSMSCHARLSARLPQDGQTGRDGTYLRHLRKSPFEVHAHPPLSLIIHHTYTASSAHPTNTHIAKRHVHCLS